MNKLKFNIMIFTELYSDSNYSISRSFGATAYRIDRNYFKVVFKNILSKAQFIFNGYTYTGYFNGEEVVIEVTDIIRSRNSTLMSFQFYDEANALIYNYEDVDLISGIKTNVYTKINLPDDFKLNFDAIPEFHISSSDSFTAYEYEHSELGTTYVITDETIEIVQGGKQVKLTQIDCVEKYVCLEWIGINGYLKNWFFLQDKLTMNSDKKISIETGDSTYNVLKNKKIDFSLIEKAANLSTQKYLSDIVFSDSVWAWISGEKIKISIDNNSASIGDKKQDISLTINLSHYDTI